MKILCILAALFTIPSFAQSVSPDPVEGIYVPFEVTLPNGGVLRYNNQAMDNSKFWVVSGNCKRDTVRNFRGVTTVVGASCVGPGVMHFQSTGQVNYSCPGDGEYLVPLHLTLRLDGVVFYDKALFADQGTICYTTPALNAVTTVAFPTVTFDNRAQARESATTVVYLEGYLPTNYTFTSDTPTIICSPWIKDINPSPYVIQNAVVGTKCQGTVPANAMATVTIQ